MIKSIIKNTAGLFGLDVVSRGKIDEEVERRIKAREQFKIQRLQELREQSRSAARNGQIVGGVQSVSRDEIEVVATSAMQDVNTLLDIGCAFRPQQRFQAKIHICCEPFHEYMDRLIVETSGESKYVYLKRNLEEVCETFPDKSVDSAYLCDVIEHVDRDVAERCIPKLQQIVRRQIILFTPIGYMPQDPEEANAETDPWGMGGMEFQKHRSGWTPEDFPADQGWTVFACEDFHQEDGYGRPLEKPFGAMWAIWNADQGASQ